MDTHIEFKRKIDNARNILVGAVPSPAGQIDQITYALIYKFMSDIDDKSARLPGGTRQYFVNEYEKYDWHNLMRLDGQDKLNRYRDALSAMSKNEHLPEIFRSIYQNAFLPYNDPRTLNLFLKEVDGFVHTKSDAIGDAYEYLLSITGAQGDVGQFRTPRHIIKFIIDVVQPGKDDTVLDPACGTAGFLIAAYNYVRMQHDGVGEDGEQNGEQRLTADERKKLHGNYYGFDIDPTMVRTATVNMYLHGFSTPNIEIHDTLTSEEHWQTRYDVILANPPFMTPKGGIQPHGKFGVKANRAEVLFVDYIASHLKPNGRAGIIVPEGIIFQSGNAYKELRKSLVENSLYAVVSLPSGVFNPYAGVKTSILLLDKELAAKKDEILFVKIENDGYSLGAQRRKTAGDQFPEALEIIERFKQGKELQAEFAHAAPRKQIAESGDYNLSGDRYKLSVLSDLSNWPVVSIGEHVDYVRGITYSKTDEVTHDGIKVLRANNIDVLTGELNLNDVKLVARGVKVKDTQKLLKSDIFICAASGSKEHIGKVTFISDDTEYYFGGFMAALRTKPGLDPKYLFYQLRSKRFNEHLRNSISGVNINNLNARILGSFKIPLPPIEIQREIVAELDGYQKIIDSAQTIVQSYKPTIKINPEWEISTIGDVCEVGSSKRVFEKDWKTEGVPFYRAREIVSLAKDGFVENKLFISEDMFDEYSKKFGKPEAGDIMVTGVGTLGVTYLVKNTDEFYFKDGNIIWMKNFSERCSSVFLERLFTTDFVKNQIKAQAAGGTVGTYTISAAKNTKIPLPPIELQREIVAELEAEQKLVNANKKLIEIYQQKIKSKIADVWGEE